MMATRFLKLTHLVKPLLNLFWPYIKLGKTDLTRWIKPLLETKSNCNLLTLPHSITIIKTLEKTQLLKSPCLSQHASLTKNWKKLRNVWNKGKKIRGILPTNHMLKPPSQLPTFSN